MKREDIEKLKNDPQIKLAFSGGIAIVEIIGPASLYRFAGYREDGNQNNPKGSWWFSKEVFQDFDKKSKNINITFTEFAKYRLALPDSWNDKLHIYELNLSQKDRLLGLKGVAAYQRLNGKNKLEKEEKSNYDHIVMIGGHEQLYFDYNDINKYPVQQIFVF